MKETLKQRTRLFVENRQTMKEYFRWENSLMHLLCGEIYTEKEKKIEVERIRECKNIIKENVGIFSNFRSHSNIAFAAILSLEENPSEIFQRILKVYRLLKNEFFSSEYLALTALTIVQMVEPYDYGRIIAKTKNIYSLMKSEHPFLTSSEDSNFAALLAISQFSEQELIRKTEASYEILKERFGSFNACQSLSNTLALGEEDISITSGRTIEIYEKLYARNYKFGKSYELPTLGVLALSNTETEETVADIITVFEYLRNSKGFGSFTISKKQCLMYSAMLTASEYSNNIKNHSIQAVALNSITSIIIAQQVAVTAAIIASSSAASSASS